LFPFITTGNHPGGEKPFNIFTVENLIANFGISQTLSVKPPPLAPVLPPTDEIVAARKISRNHLVSSLTTQFFGLIVLMMIFGVGVAAFFGICALVFWLYFTNNSVGYLREELEVDLSDAQQQWATFENEWARNALPPKLSDDLSQIKKKVGDYQKFQQTSVRQVKLLRDNQARLQMHEHLRSARLADAEIYGIREKQLQSLVENGFETAAEMDSGRLRCIPEIGKRTIAKLLDWRRELECNFTVESDEDNLKEEQTKLAVEAAGERRRIEREIEQLLGSLRFGAVSLRRRQQELSAQAAELATRLAQTKSNAEHLGTNSPAIIGLILITFLTPYVGFIVGQINERSSYSSRSGTGYDMPPKPAAKYPKTELEVPGEDITDAEIAALSNERRTAYATNLFSQVTENIYSDNPDYEQGERKMRLAIRLDADDPSFLNQLGHILYEQGKYKESLKHLNQSLKIDPKNNGTKIYIGINYLKTNRFKDARAILTEVTTENSSSFEGNYNLGLAHIGLKNYDIATEALQKAVFVGRDDVDAHYQLGYCYYKLGREDEVYEEYETLLKLDETVAERFGEETEIVPRKVIIQSK